MSKNYFELLGVEQSFDVDVERVEKNYLQLQKQFHPDRYAQSSPHEKRLAAVLTANINEARQCLLDDVARAQYLLKLQGVERGEQQTVNDPEFLFKQMEYREQAQQLITMSPSQERSEKASQFVNSVKAEYQSLCHEFVSLYDDEKYTDALGYVSKMQFMNKLLSELALAA